MEDIYRKILPDIEANIFKLESYIDILQVYAEDKMCNNNHIGNIYKLLCICKDCIKNITTLL